MRAFGFNRCQKGGLKKRQKRRKKRNAGFTVKTDSGAVGPFKKKKTRHQKIRKLDRGPNTPDEPKGTVADILYSKSSARVGN